MLNKILRTFRTLKYLKLSQLWFLFARRVIPTKLARLSFEPQTRAEFKLAEPISTHTCGKDENSFLFVGINQIFNIEEINWEPDDKSELWRFNLHYFDFLRDDSRTLDNKLRLIDSWVKNCKQGVGPAWGPFTNSLRVTNWIYFFSQIDAAKVKNEWVSNLYAQAVYIEKNNERELLANHYFENIKALLFAGVYFSGKQADRWLKKAQSKLSEQLNEQFLHDGGHYEKSPQYHSLMLENCLDLYNLFANNRAVCDQKIKNHLLSQCESSLHWLMELQYHNGEFPLFNDSANNVAPSCNDLYQYANRLFRYEPAASIVSGGKIICLDESGYYGFEAKSDKFIIDCGDISPSYQPGHMHCDFLSYELVFNDQLLIVDSGVYEYEEGEMRTYVRSTQAHNTVSVDGDQQSEIWAAFRVARRAQKLNASIDRRSDGAHFSGAYSGFYSVRSEIIHRRDVDIITNERCDAIDRILIDDEIKCSGQHEAESFIHLHPDITYCDKSNGLIELFHHGEMIAQIMINEALNYKVSSSYYCPEFGKKLENPVIVINKSGASLIKISYAIIKV